MKKQTQKKSFKNIIVSVMLAISVMYSFSGFLFLPENVAHAEPGDTTSTTTTTSLSDNEDIRQTMGFVTSIQDLLNYLLDPVLLLIGSLLDNSILFGAGMEERMREIWIPIRNLTNLIFVIGLLGIALYNILGFAEDTGNTTIKTILPKMAVGIVAINFSFLGVKVFMDAVNVGTAAIFSLPHQISENYGKIDYLSGEVGQPTAYCTKKSDKTKTPLTNNPSEYPTQYATYSGIIEDSYCINTYTQVTGKDTLAKTCDEITGLIGTEAAQYDKAIENVKEERLCAGPYLTERGQQFFDRFGSNNVAMALAQGMGKIMFYQDYRPSLDTPDKLLVSTIFSMILYIIYALSFVALLAVLIARLVVVWLVTVMSPLIIIGMAIPAVKTHISGISEISDKFVKHAIAPIAIAIPMTIGWIMLKSLKSVNAIESSIGSAPNILTSITAGIPVAGLETMQDLIIAVATIAVVWIGIVSGVKDTYASMIVDPMMNAVKGVGKYIATAPLRMNLIPITLPNEGGVVKANLNVMGDLINNIGENQRLRDNELLKKITGINVAKTFAEVQDSEKATDLIDYLSRTKETPEIVKANIETLSKDNKAFVDELKNSNNALYRRIEAVLALGEGATPEQTKEKVDDLRREAERQITSTQVAAERNTSGQQSITVPAEPPALSSNTDISLEGTRTVQLDDGELTNLTTARNNLANATNRDEAINHLSTIIGIVNNKLPEDQKLPTIDTNSPTETINSAITNLQRLLGTRLRNETQTKINQETPAAPATEDSGAATAPAADTAGTDGATPTGTTP